MDKSQALYKFWSGFDIPAYDETSIPLSWKTDEENKVPQLPYITYETMTDSIGGVLPLSASIWCRSSTWEWVSKKADEIARFIGYGYMTVKIDGGYLWIVRGIPFTRRMADENDPMVKRIIINIMAEFLTAY